MVRWCVLVAVVVGCKSDGDSPPPTAAGSAGSGSAKTSGSGGFSAGLSADLAKQHGSNDDARGSSDAGLAAAADAATAMVATAPDAAEAKLVDAGGLASTTKPVDASTVVAIADAPVLTHGPVKVSAELAAIKLSLLPNWDRDIDQPGSISLFVKVPGRSDSTMFVFRYGYEDPKAPAERDAYIKWLADFELLDVATNRQRGAAWYLEGTDGGGAPAFRFLVNYGGKHLICYGGLYKDSDSNRLGDLRDQVIIQAKQICETLAL